MFFLDFSFFILIFVALTRSQEFIRVGYYVSNEYTDPELQETPPGKTFVFSLGFKNFVIRLLLQKQRAASNKQFIVSILEKPDFDKLQRNILASNPRVTKVNIMIFAIIQ